jgi:hypothetical protein
MNNVHHKRWIGFGVKSGGQLAVVGLESTGAVMINLGNLEHFWLRIMNARYGLGLGGGAGVVAILAFGLVEPYELHGQEVSDWGFNISIAAKLGSKSTMQSLVFARQFHEIYETQRALNSFKAAKAIVSATSMLENVRNGLSTLYNVLEATKQKGVVSLDVPFAGGGVELSAYITRGHMAVQGSSDMDLGDYR